MSLAPGVYDRDAVLRVLCGGGGGGEAASSPPLWPLCSASTPSTTSRGGGLFGTPAMDLLRDASDAADAGEGVKAEAEESSRRVSSALMDGPAFGGDCPSPGLLLVAQR